MRIAVLMGGDSPEREISLATGRAVAEALREKGHEVEALDIPRVAATCDLGAVAAADVVFPALHGGEGEDGHVQALLEIMGRPYALSGPLACAAAMNKALSKRVLRGAGIPTPDWFLVSWDGTAGRPRRLEDAARGTERRAARLTLDHICRRADAELGFPVVVKPNSAGSSVGVVVVERPGDFAAAFVETAVYDSNVLVEKYIPGRELSATIFLARRLPLVEIRPRQGFYDYANKYTEGASEYLVPAPVHSPVYEQICSDALRAHDLLDCRGVVRVDFRLDGDDYYCLELNTVPGMTATSIVPMAAAAVGIGFGDLLEDVCRQALAADETAGETATGEVAPPRS